MSPPQDPSVPPSLLGIQWCHPVTPRDPTTPSVSLPRDPMALPVSPPWDPTATPVSPPRDPTSSLVTFLLDPMTLPVSPPRDPAAPPVFTVYVLDMPAAAPSPASVRQVAEPPFSRLIHLHPASRRGPHCKHRRCLFCQACQSTARPTAHTCAEPPLNRRLYYYRLSCFYCQRRAFTPGLSHTCCGKHSLARAEIKKQTTPSPGTPKQPSFCGR